MPCGAPADAWARWPRSRCACARPSPVTLPCPTRDRRWPRSSSRPMRCAPEELPAGWREPEWEAVAAGLPRAVSADTARALIGCPNRAAAEAVATAIQAPGRLGRHRSAAGGGDAAIRSVGAAQRRPGPRAAACLTGRGAANTTAGGSRTAPCMLQDLRIVRGKSTGPGQTVRALV